MKGAALWPNVHVSYRRAKNRRHSRSRQRIIGDAEGFIRGRSQDVQLEFQPWDA